jgi:ribosome-associated protein
LPGPLTVRPGVVVPGNELRWRFSHASGPGGQSVNTSDTRVELSLDIATSTAFSPLQRDRALDRLATRLVDGVITVTASEHRSQLRNREAAMLRLAELLRRAIAPPAPPRRSTAPTRASVRRRLDAKSRRGALKRERRTGGDP